MLTLFDYLQSKESPEDRLDYKSVFNHFVKDYKWGPQYHIDKYEECQAHHFRLMDDYIKKRKEVLFCDWEGCLERV